MRTLDIADRIAAAVIARREGRPALSPRDRAALSEIVHPDYDMDGWETGEWKEKDNENETEEEE